MTRTRRLTIDGNEAAAYIAHLTSEVIAIYPITPASPMGELADDWSALDKPNLWGSVPRVIEMQSEAGAAAAVHGALQTGALTTTFTASQGLLLMIPEMYKIAGELSPLVIHVAARSVAAQALSIFGDHSDVMTTRSTGFAQLASGSVQEVMDLALIAQAATLQSRVPFLHFFDGFRTSHEISKIDAVDIQTVRSMIDEQWIHDFRRRALNPERPVIRGTSQNPDVFFQARESVNPYYTGLPAIVQATMNRFAELSGRQYHLFDYVGDATAEKVIILMGSGAETVHETVDFLNHKGDKVGLLKVRLFRPFSTAALLTALPTTTTHIAVLDRTKEPGAEGEPLYKDIHTALSENHQSSEPHFSQLPRIVGGRFGLSSKEFTPAMVKSVFDELGKPQPKNHFTVGIIDDVSHTSLTWDTGFHTAVQNNMVCCLFYGLGSDGTVSANKNSIKIIAEQDDLYAQGYFVYDSKKSGAVTISHLRFGPEPIRSSYLIGEDQADFIACHQTVFLERHDMLLAAKKGATFLLNSPAAPDAVWDSLPAETQQQIIDKEIKLFSIDAYSVAARCNMGRRINTIMQACFFAISGVLPQQEAIERIKAAVDKTYGRKSRRIVELNYTAIDQSLDNLHEIATPASTSSATTRHLEFIPRNAPEFVREVTAELIARRGDLLPVSKFPADGTWPLGTAAYEKRNIALEIPVLDPDLCIQCGKCPLVCPHGVIRSKIFTSEQLKNAPADFKYLQAKGKEFTADHYITYQVAPEDCTGCGLCVDICPARDKSQHKHKALDMVAYTPQLRAREKSNWEFFLGLPEYDRTRVRPNIISSSMLFQPLFEFSGACTGCGETPYIKLASQLFGDRMIVANATGCSSIYGGNLPTTPWSTNQEGRGPAWNNSLFEDNAEFALGMRAAIDMQRQYAEQLLRELQAKIGEQLVFELCNAEQNEESGIHAQRERLHQLRNRLGNIDGHQARALESVADNLLRRSIWAIGGDGWAYDIGYGGLDHVLASGCDINILVLDTEVYSNTGGQSSKATPRAAVAKFAASGKAVAKKDLALLAMDYGHVYVAHVAYGAKDAQTLRAFLEAESYQGPSLIIAYSPCIAHGVDLKNNHRQQDLAVRSGHWPLYRYDPRLVDKNKNPLSLDSKKPSIPYADFALTETRFSMLQRSHPEEAAQLLAQAQTEVMDRYHHYAQLADISYAHEEPPGKSTEN